VKRDRPSRNGHVLPPKTVTILCSGYLDSELLSYYPAKELGVCPVPDASGGFVNVHW